MKTIVKHCKTIKDAERIQDDLYDEYRHVRLVRFPHFSEEGIYAWEVKD